MTTVWEKVAGAVTMTTSSDRQVAIARARVAVSEGVETARSAAPKAALTLASTLA